jgi:hypothetical protein|tara:strand:- start:842 stop:1009 length:168 start_codon:yes stop_codon:yes gene_type:complete
MGAILYLQKALKIVKRFLTKHTFTISKSQYFFIQENGILTGKIGLTYKMREFRWS